MSWRDDLLRARDANLSDAMSRAPLDDLAAWWRSSLPYRFDGQGHVILDVRGCLRRGYGACADAAASLAAAAKLQGKRAQLCIEEYDELPGYAHVRVLVDGVAYDPYSRWRPATLPPMCSETVTL